MVTCGIKFSRTFNFADFEFFEFRGKHFSRIWMSGFTPRKNFSWISCTVLESNKSGSHVVVFVTLFATNFIAIFRKIFFGGSLYPRDLIFADPVENPRNKQKLDPTKNFMPRGIPLKKRVPRYLVILGPYCPHRGS